jgi:pSer/pThr/pTyr-binding forkhead associated (FHA) protein
VTPLSEGQVAAKLVLVGKDGSRGLVVPIVRSIEIGRTDGDVMLPDDEFVSPRHARLAARPGGGIVLLDLDTPNGIYLRVRASGTGEGGAPGTGAPPNAEDAEEGVELRDQDLFLVGQQVIRFELVSTAEEGFGPARERGTLLFGTPFAPRYGRLCQRTVEGVTRDVHYLRKVDTVLGRESGDIVFTDDPFLSRRHARVRAIRESKRFFLADLGSSNGTFVRVRKETVLDEGDEFRVGQQLFRIEGVGGAAHA